MFGEPPKYATSNREHAANIHTEPAKLADQSYGAVLFYSRFFMTLTRDEAVKVATMLVKTIETIDRLNTQPNMKRKRTRSYETKETTNE